MGLPQAFRWVAQPFQRTVLMWWVALIIHIMGKRRASEYQQGVVQPVAADVVFCRVYALLQLLLQVLQFWLGALPGKYGFLQGDGAAFEIAVHPL